MESFSPAGSSATISGTTSTSRVALGNANHDKVMIANTSATIPAYVQLGDVTVEAVVATSIVVLPNTYLVLQRNPQSHTYLAGITSSSTAGLIVTTGS